MNYLISGSDYLKLQPKFNLIGRNEELNRLISILVRNKASSVILAGPRGVGCESLVLGIQEYKNKPNVPFDIVSKRLFWLDSNSLFSSGNTTDINAEFQKIMRRIERTTNSILIIEDTKDFLESARNAGCSHFVNSLISAVRRDLTQVILMCYDDGLEYVLKTHSDFFEYFTLMSLDEPKGIALNSIVKDAADKLSSFHGIKYKDDAVEAAIEQTSKSQNASLSAAQPEKAITLLDRAFATYKLNSHKNPPKNFPEETWQEYQKRLLALYQDQRANEDFIVELEEKLVNLANENTNKTPEIPDSALGSFERLTSGTGFDTPDMLAIKNKIKLTEKDVAEIKEEYATITTKINDNLTLDWDEVTKEFSLITGISVDKLNQDETEKLRNLEPTLLKRIYGQDDAMCRIANAIKSAKLARKNNGKPLASFMFLGSSGVGKTETAKALAFSIYDDENYLLRFDMSEYMEKHAVAKLIGAPPGYEGFEVGGILTNAMRKNGNPIILFDEIEKAHPDVFNILLQVLSDGRLTDNIGRVVSFQDSILLLTTNIGQTAFLDENMSDLDMAHQANIELEATYRNEFLNRFNGRENIILFKRLQLESIIKIVKREISNLDSIYKPLGAELVIEEETLQRLCKDKYNPRVGARGLPGFINAYIEPYLTNALLAEPPQKGVYRITYDENGLGVKLS